MRLKLSQLKSIIKEEISRLFESVDPKVLKSVLDSEDLIDIADKVRDMNLRKVPASAIVKFLEGAIVGDVKAAIQHVIDNATPAQLAELQYEATFGDVDALSAEYEKTLLHDPLEAMQVIKGRLAKDQIIQGIDVISLQLKAVHDVLDDLLMGGPVGLPKKKGFLSFLSAR